MQILQTLAKGPFECKLCKKAPVIPEMDYCPNCKLYRIIRITPWSSHPAVKMWKGWECTLVEYAAKICREWKRRGFKDTVMDKIWDIHFKPSTIHIVKELQQGHNEFYTPWLGNHAFHASHRSNLLRKDPKHYSQFGWIERDDLPYVWPVK